MSFESYRGKPVTIKSTATSGVIDEILRYRGAGGGLAVRYVVKDAAGKVHELMPHEVQINQSMA